MPMEVKPSRSPSVVWGQASPQPSTALAKTVSSEDETRGDPGTPVKVRNKLKSALMRSARGKDMSLHCAICR